jgi:uncharacterized protein YukE
MNENNYFDLKPAITNIISELRTEAESLRSNIAKIDEVITGCLVPTNWRGSAADAYKSSFVVLRDGALARFEKFLSSYAEALEVALNDANASQQQLSQYADRLKGLD